MPARETALRLVVCLAALALGACAGHKPPTSSPLPATAKGAVAAKDTATAKPRPRRARVDSAALEARVVSRHAHVPLARALARRTGNHRVADRVALAVVREAQHARLSPSLVAGVLLIENTPLDTVAVSRAGAVGLMQVMPFHAGSLGCASTQLTELDANICHGTRVLRTYVRRSRTLHTALRRYNGCMGQHVTPRCRRYPVRVLRAASSIRREMLVTAAATSKSVAAR